MTEAIPDLHYTLDRLEGGTRLLCAPMRDRTSAAIVLMLSAGSRHEPEEIGGVSHFIEHLCFKGTARRTSSKEIAEAIEGVGGVLNASTDKESTLYYARVPAARLALAADVVTDLVLGPRFEPEDLERERTVILEEIKMYEDLPQEHVHTMFEECLWPDHPLGRDIAGTRASVGALTRAQLAEYASTHYRSGRMLAVVAGAVDVDESRRILTPLLEGAPAGDGNAYEPAIAQPSASRLLLRNRRTEQAHLVVGGRSSSYSDPLRYAEELLNTILGEGMSSRLFLEVRERLGLAYDVHSFMNKYADTGAHGVYLGVDPRRAHAALDAVLGEMRRLAETPVEPPELEKAREYYKGRLLLSLESTNGLAAWLGGQELLLGSIQQPAQTLAAIDAVTAADVQQAARRLFVEQPLSLAVIGSFRSEASFLRQLAI